MSQEGGGVNISKNQFFSQYKTPQGPPPPVRTSRQEAEEKLRLVQDFNLNHQPRIIANDRK